VGALWQVIQDERDTSISEVSVAGDRAYLQELGEKVARGEEPDRTDVESDEGLRITVSMPGVGLADLDVSDLSGETLRLLVENRIWHEQLRRALDGVNAVLLFVHPDKIRQPIRIAFTKKILTKLVTESAEDSSTAPEGQLKESNGVSLTRPGAKAPDFLPRFSCTSAKLIDGLENLLGLMRREWPLRLGVVVSAWDAVADDITPGEWLQDRLPALAEMLRSNPERVEAAVFGVSAQGGRIPADRDRLLKIGRVLDRCYARDANGTAVPLSEPVRWAIAE
jgi:hypothetical protein